VSAELRQQLKSLDPAGLAFIEAEQAWLKKALDPDLGQPGAQIMPIAGWTLAIALAGRGFGKTEMGANWLRRECLTYPGITCHVVAPSHADLIGTIFDGISGILAVTPAELIEEVNRSAAIPFIRFKNKSLIRGFSSQSPERLRGPQCSRLWGDEVAAWGVGAEATLVNIDMSTRISYKTQDGRVIQPQRLYTTTPKPLSWLSDIVKRAQHVVRGSTYDNKKNLAEDFIRDLSMYEDTQIGRQEIYGELLDISEAAIIKRPWLRLWPNNKPMPWFEFVMVGMDTAYTEKTFDKKTFEADPTACQVWGIFAHEMRWQMMLLDCWEDHLGFPELVRRARHEMKREYGRRSEALFKPLIGDEMRAEQVKHPDLLIIEDKGSGISLRQMLSQEGQDSWPYNPGRADKLSRLHSVSHVAAGGLCPDGKFRAGVMGRVWLPESTKTKGEFRNWTNKMVDELCSYSGPGTTKHDDHVDVFSMCTRYYADRWLTAGVEGKIKTGQITVDATSFVGEEWIEGEDRRPGQGFEEEIDNWYG
jgi:phage terminase large subunit-like protein